MGINKSVKTGNTLNLKFQLQDGEDNLPIRVFARLRDELGDPITPNPVEMSHVGEGLFVENNVLMPANEFITVHYLPKLPGPAANTPFADLEESCLHGIDVDRYVNREANLWDTLLSEIVGEDTIGLLIKDRLDQKISAVDNSRSDLTGVLEPDLLLSGVIDDESIEMFGFVNESDLCGEIESEVLLIGVLDASENLTGVIDE